MFGDRIDYLEMELHEYNIILEERTEYMKSQPPEWLDSKNGKKYEDLTADIEEKIEKLKALINNKKDVK